MMTNALIRRCFCLWQRAGLSPTMRRVASAADGMIGSEHLQAAGVAQLRRRTNPQGYGSMKLGLITDIHEQVEHLHSAIDRFRREQVDQVVVIGDLFQMGEQIEETCRLLAEANAIGVWGNHDFGLCAGPDDDTRGRYPEAVIDYMTSLRPRLDVGGCHFTHVEPWLDPGRLEDLWYFDGPPDEHGKLSRIFGAVPNRIMFAGHFHKWLLATPVGISGWQGEAPIRLDTGRWFVVVGALCDGRFAIFDTETSELVPFNE
jgi:predicted phosphodiesterase